MLTRSRTIRWIVIPLALSAGIGFGVWKWSSIPVTAEEWMNRAETAIGNDDPTALEYARRAALLDPANASAWLMIARLSQERGTFADAVDAWKRVPASSAAAAAARLQAAETALVRLGQFDHAERLYHNARELAPNDPAPLEGLARLLAVEGRWRDLTPVLLRLIQMDACSNFHLDLLLRGPDTVVEPQLLPSRDQLAADEVGALCGLARLAIQKGDLDQASRDLDMALQREPRSSYARILQGRILLTIHDVAGSSDWLRSAPDDLRAEPDYWRIALLFARETQDNDTAFRAAWEILARDATDVNACLEVARGLARRGDAKRAAEFTDRARQLEALTSAVSAARRPGNWEAVRKVVETAESLGLTWEAYAWSRLAARLNPRLTWTGPAMRRLSGRIPHLELVRAEADSNPANRLFPKELPEATFGLSKPTPRESVQESASRVAFCDEASRIGLAFQFRNGGDPRGQGLRQMYEFTGGGVGVIDFDLDGAPDLFFPQGGDFARRGERQTDTDHLWWNHPDGSWREVGKSAGLVDTGFGQGASVGDVDNDGFPDLLVLNIGANVMWRNLGDGTFETVQPFTSHTGNEWSISGAIADIDSDSVPDVYVANYLGGDDVFRRICPDSHGVLRLSCQPLIFPAAPDQLLHGTGDTGFVDVTAAWGLDRPEGRGMGVVVGRMTRDQTLDIYVANDATANFHFVADDAPASPVRRFVDEAFQRGTAVGRDGRAQASMGVGLGDADGDGRLDLVVTNFEGESSTLYQRQPDGTFVDRSEQMGIAGPSRNLLGFGTQFLDANLDGFPEILSVNGHVNDQRENGSLFQMPPQIFRNLGGRRFDVVPPSEAGPYFEGHYLGRGLAILDANRDGRPDAVISNLDRPAALLMNESPILGHWLQVRCIGTTSARDAIGTQGMLAGDGFEIVRHVTAGDGYASSNQRILCYGISRRDEGRASLTIQWPGGQIHEFATVPLDREIIIIEGREDFVPIRSR